MAPGPSPTQWMGSERLNDLCQSSPTFTQVGESTQFILELIEVREADLPEFGLEPRKNCPIAS